MMILIRLAHLLWEQGVVGSNPATPTKEKGFDNQWFDAVFKAFFIIKIFILLIKNYGKSLINCLSRRKE